jgi:hypothetical protein
MDTTVFFCRQAGYGGSQSTRELARVMDTVERYDSPAPEDTGRI